MARCFGVNQSPHSYGEDREVDGLWRALDDLNANAYKLDTIFEELRVMIVVKKLRKQMVKKNGDNEVNNIKCVHKMEDIEPSTKFIMDENMKPRADNGGGEIYGSRETKQLIN
ncbi:hypothetical protein L1987_22196 [Smallanthus sonchifolius]|uniref:Uncharacterized protein n=1 Tax=Smallanthus sonchifolius TaxID=185202 RepID=A0ACB9IES8_9ASTR|nr:hypothetical protein L1987_22196 [Smallanthus sonchifolius]